MFKSARIKLTIWYLFIIMFISLSFSGVIYKETLIELERGFRRIELRHQAEEMGIPLPRFFPNRSEDLPSRLKEVPMRYFLTEDFAEAQKRLIFNLSLINGAILCFSTLAGYFLAGKTLKPIENALEEQKRFIADASHELRTPLTALKTSMEVALRAKRISLKEAKRVLKSDLEEVEGLTSLSDRLLSLARYQSNGNHLVFKRIPLAAVIEKAYQKILPLAKSKKIIIKVQIQDLKLQASEESLVEMLVILLDNAIKYSPQKAKVVVIATSEQKNLLIEVKDAGIGINQEDLAHIFDRFYRTDQARSKTKVAGFGLGLALAKRIIEIHRGSVAVASKIGQGTTFTIKLPLKHG